MDRLKRLGDGNRSAEKRIPKDTSPAYQSELNSVIDKVNELVDSENTETPAVSSEDNLYIYRARLNKNNGSNTITAYPINTGADNFLKNSNGDTITWEIGSNTDFTYINGTCTGRLDPTYTTIYVTIGGGTPTIKYAAAVSRGHCIVAFNSVFTTYTQVYVEIIEQKPNGAAPPLYNITPVEANTNVGGNTDAIEILFDVNLHEVQIALELDSFTVTPENTITAFEIDETNNKLLKLSVDTPTSSELPISIAFTARSPLISYQYVEVAAFNIPVAWEED